MVVTLLTKMARRQPAFLCLFFLGCLLPGSAMAAAAISGVGLSFAEDLLGAPESGTYGDDADLPLTIHVAGCPIYNPNSFRIEHTYTRIRLEMLVAGYAATAVPEPSCLSVLAAALGTLGFAARRRSSPVHSLRFFACEPIIEIKYTPLPSHPTP